MGGEGETSHGWWTAWAWDITFFGLSLFADLHIRIGECVMGFYMCVMAYMAVSFVFSVVVTEGKVRVSYHLAYIHTHIHVQPSQHMHR